MKSQVLSCLLILLNFSLLTQSIKFSHFEKVKKVITYNLASHYKPSTLRIICQNFTQFETNFHDWEFTYQIAPVLLLPERLSPRHHRVHFFTSTVAYFLFDEESKNCAVNHLHSETANRRWDRLILFSGNDKFIRDPVILKLLNGYRFKMVMSLESNSIWVEPKRFETNSRPHYGV